MSYDQELAGRVRRKLKGKRNLREMKMFGGLSFLLGGRMCCGIVKDDLMVRVAPEKYEVLRKEPHARPMDFTGRPLKGFLFIEPGGYRSDSRLGFWLEQALSGAASAATKKKGKRHGAQGRPTG